jgi:hypothetical protein
LNYAEKIVDSKNPRELMEYELYYNMSYIWAGKWDEIKEYSEPLVEENLKIGEIWHVIVYLYKFGMLSTNQGKFSEADYYIQKCREIGDTYDYPYARQAFFIMGAGLDNIKSKFHDALISSNEGVNNGKKFGMEPYLLGSLGTRAFAQAHLKDVDGARESLSWAADIVHKQGYIPPVIDGARVTSQIYFDLEMIEETIKGNEKKPTRGLRKKTYESVKKGLKIGKQVAFSKVFFLNSAGRYFWIVDNQAKAIKYWRSAIEEGKRLDTRPDLARTYMEIGKRLLEGKSRYRELNGVPASEYLEMAREMFEEMDLQWDLDELDRIVSYR